MLSYKCSVISMLLLKNQTKPKNPTWYHSYRLIEPRDGIYTTNMNLTVFQIYHFVENLEAF